MNEETSAPLEFRVWDQDAKKWLNNFLLGNSGRHIFDAAETSSEGQPKVITQYTGKKDSNGAKEFAGDILRLTIKNSFGSVQTILAELYYSTEQCGFLIRDRSVMSFASALKEEVVGNIFEHPDMELGVARGDEPVITPKPYNDD